MSSTPNANPINSLYSLNGVPLFTYGMIGMTTIALACVTMMDDSNKSYAKDEGFEQSKTEGSNTFSFFSSKKSDETTSEESNNDKSMFSSFGFGKKDESTVDQQESTEKPKDSMFSSFGFGKKDESTEKPQESILSSFSNEGQKDEDKEKEAQKQGGKSRKTKYNISKYKHNKSKKVSYH